MFWFISLWRAESVFSCNGNAPGRNQLRILGKQELGLAQLPVSFDWFLVGRTIWFVKKTASCCHFRALDYLLHIWPPTPRPALSPRRMVEWKSIKLVGQTQACPQNSVSRTIAVSFPIILENNQTHLPGTNFVVHCQCGSTANNDTTCRGLAVDIVLLASWFICFFNSLD